MAGVWCDGQRERRRGRQNQGRSLPAPRAASANAKVRTLLCLQDCLGSEQLERRVGVSGETRGEREQERATEASLEGP